MERNYFEIINSNYIIKDVIEEKFSVAKNQKENKKNFLEYFNEIIENYSKESEDKFSKEEILKDFEKRLKKLNKTLNDKLEQKILIHLIYQAKESFEKKEKNIYMDEYEYEIFLEEYNDFKYLFSKMEQKYKDILEITTLSIIESINEIADFKYDDESIKYEIDFFTDSSDLPNNWIKEIINTVKNQKN